MATPQAAQGSEAAENPQAHGGATSPDLPIGTDRSVNERYWRCVPPNDPAVFSAFFAVLGELCGHKKNTRDRKSTLLAASKILPEKDVTQLQCRVPRPSVVA